jgi:ACS family hexuronate transporter-like MFS transporter
MNATAAPGTILKPGGHFRWAICALLFFVITINSIDRQVLGVLKPIIEDDLGWSEIDYGRIVLAFQASYAVGLLVVGRLLDKIGTRLGMAIAITLWSVAAMFHAAARTVLAFMLARVALGLAESAAYPGAVKSVAEWFPQRERALGVGFLNAGANVGVVMTPIVGIMVAGFYGWQAAFLVTGAIGFLVLVAWLLMYRQPQQHPKVSPAELAYIEQDGEDGAGEPLGWGAALRQRQTWYFICAKFFTDPVWYLFLFWLPDFLVKTQGMDLFPKADAGIFSTIGPALVGVYLLADVGSIAGGWLSGRFIKQGWSVNRARKTTLFLAALCAVPLLFVLQIDNPLAVVLIIGLATAGHQAFSSNIFTMISDLYPRRAIATVAGLGGCAGSIGGMLMAESAGRSLEYLGSYMPLLIYAGLAYLIAFGVIHLLVPKMEPAPL